MDKGTENQEKEAGCAHCNAYNGCFSEDCGELGGSNELAKAYYAGLQQAAERGMGLSTKPCKFCNAYNGCFSEKCMLWHRNPGEHENG